MAHMILDSIVHWRHYHQTFKSMRLGGLVIVQWRISSPGIYMVFPLISPLFLFLILTVQLLVKVSSVQPVEHSARVLTKDLSLVPTAASLGTWHSEVRVGGMPYLKQAQLQCACGPLGQGQCIGNSYISCLSSLSIFLTPILTIRSFGMTKHRHESQLTSPSLWGEQHIHKALETPPNELRITSLVP